MIRGQVYKVKANNSQLQTPIYVGVSNVLMMNVSYDQTRQQEFLLNTTEDFHQTVGAFNGIFEIVEGVSILDQVDAYEASR